MRTRVSDDDIGPGSVNAFAGDGSCWCKELRMFSSGRHFGTRVALRVRMTNDRNFVQMSVVLLALTSSACATERGADTSSQMMEHDAADGKADNWITPAETSRALLKEFAADMGPQFAWKENSAKWLERMTPLTVATVRATTPETVENWNKAAAANAQQVAEDLVVWEITDDSAYIIGYAVQTRGQEEGDGAILYVDALGAFVTITPWRV